MTSAGDVRIDNEMSQADEAALDTFEYQARPFYEKLGYQLFGTLDGYPPGYRQFYLRKRLSPPTV